MPRISIIIPTAGRPDLLRRAILSCFPEEHNDDIEVLVIANGPDSSWKCVQSDLHHDSRVSFYYHPLADQCNARNLGIELSRGIYIRFLDDDDYLFPEAAHHQLALMESENLDFSSANVVCSDQDGNIFSRFSAPDTDSGTIAALSRDRLQLPFAHVYRRSSIEELRWPVGLRQSEDIVWLIRYVAAKPRRWKKIDVDVGAWYQHTGLRQSLDRPSGFIHEATADILLEAESLLKKQDRWESPFSVVISQALMEIVHRAFPFRPIHWSKIAGHALRLDPDARPSAAVYTFPVLSRADPRLILWLLLLKRLANLGTTAVVGMLRGREYRRTL